MPRIAPLELDSAPESVKQLLWQQQLDKRLRELAILRVANLRQAAFEWDQHVGISRAAGVSPEQIRAIESGRIDAPCFDGLQRLVLEATTELAETSTLQRLTFDRLAAQLPPREVVELLLAAGVYEALAKLMNALDLESEGPIDPDFARAVNAGSVERAASRS